MPGNPWSPSGLLLNAKAETGFAATLLHLPRNVWRSLFRNTLPASDQYQLMGEAFCRAVRGEAPLPYGLDDARANMRILDALFRSETSGQWEEVGA